MPIRRFLWNALLSKLLEATSFSATFRSSISGGGSAPIKSLTSIGLVIGNRVLCDVSGTGFGGGATGNTGFVGKAS